MFNLLPPAITNSINDFKQLVIAADAQRASGLLIELCEEFPVLAGTVTLLQQGSIDQALNNVGLFNRELAAELRLHMNVLHQISRELQTACVTDADIQANREELLQSIEDRWDRW